MGVPNALFYYGAFPYFFFVFIYAKHKSWENQHSKERKAQKQNSHRLAEIMAQNSLVVATRENNWFRLSWQPLKMVKIELESCWAFTNKSILYLNRKWKINNLLLSNFLFIKKVVKCMIYFRILSWSNLKVERRQTCKRKKIASAKMHIK